jgi:putative Mg2+ transporter-C (MgtC) family protein
MAQIGELPLAFVLASFIGVEREVRGKPAGRRTQTIIGTTAALVLLASKYGFGDVLAQGRVVPDPPGWPPRSCPGRSPRRGSDPDRQGAVRGADHSRGALGDCGDPRGGGGRIAPVGRGFDRSTSWWSSATPEGSAGCPAVVSRCCGFGFVSLDGRGALRGVSGDECLRLLDRRDLPHTEPTEIDSDDGSGRAVRVILSLSGSGDHKDLLAHLPSCPESRPFQ